MEVLQQLIKIFNGGYSNHNRGVDLGLLGNRLNISFDAYKRNTNNMIVPMEGIPLLEPVTAGELWKSGNKRWELTVDFGHRFENALALISGKYFRF